MKTYFDFSTTDPKVQKKLVQSLIIPRPIAWITSRNENDTINIAPFSFFSMLSPTHLVVSFVKEKGVSKDTLINVLRTKEAIINIGDESLVEEIDHSSISLPYNESELDYIHVNLTAAKKVNVPLIDDAVASLEVIVESNFTLNSNDVVHEVVVFNVIATHISSDMYDESRNHVLLDKPISRLEGAKYGSSDRLKYTRKF